MKSLVEEELAEFVRSCERRTVMGRLYLCVLAAAAVGAAVLISPVGAHADSLAGSVGINWFSPNTATTFTKDTIVVGSSLNCPGSSPICTGYGFGTETFSVGSAAISSTVVYPGSYIEYVRRLGHEAPGIYS